MPQASQLRERRHGTVAINPVAGDAGGGLNLACFGVTSTGVYRCTTTEQRDQQQTLSLLGQALKHNHSRSPVLLCGGHVSDECRVIFVTATIAEPARRHRTQAIAD